MKRMTRIVPLIAVAALALTGCAGGGGDSGGSDASGEITGTVKFQSWSLKNEKFTPYFEELFAAFEEENPGVTIEWLDQPGDGYQDKVLSQANSGSLPDVINLPPDIAYPLAAAGALLDVDGADAELASTYVPGAWKSYSYPGLEGTFGLPWYLGTDLSWWNGAALTEFGVDTAALPTTTEELIALAEQVGQTSGGRMPVLSTMPTIDVFSSAGIDIMNKDGEFVFNTDEAA